MSRHERQLVGTSTVTVSPPYPLAVSWPSTSTVVTPSGSSTPLASGEGRLGRVIVTELHRGVLLPVLAEHPPAVGVALRTVVRRADGHVERGAPSPSGLVSTSVTSGKRAPAPPVSPASVDAVQPVSASTSKQTRRSAEGKGASRRGKGKDVIVPQSTTAEPTCSLQFHDAHPRSLQQSQGSPPDQRSTQCHWATLG